MHAHRMLLGHNEFDTCHDLQPGELFYGAGDWAWSLLKVFGPWRARAVEFVYHQGPRFDPVALFDALAEHQVSNMMVNPTTLRMLRDAVPDVGDRYGWRPRIVCCTNEPLHAGVIEWFHEQFDITLLDFYGCTESYPMISNRPDVPVRPGSMGTITPGWDIALLDEKEEPVPNGIPGEVCLRARSNPQYPLGYWNRPDASRAVFGGEWFHTRDVATRDDDGYFWYVGRNDDIIISAGYRIGPHEVEAALNTHPAVAESAVVGLPDAERGHRVHATVVLQPGQRGDNDLVKALQDHVKTHYSLFAYPRSIEFAAALPRSTTNKIQRAEIRRQALTRPSRRHP